MKTIFRLLFVNVCLISSVYSFAQSPNGTSCDQAIPIGCDITVSGSTSGVLNDNASGVPATCLTSVGTGGQIWYVFTATSSDIINAFTCGPDTNFDTQLHVFTGSCGALTCLTGNDDACSLASSVSFVPAPGIVYYIRVGGFSSTNGNFSLSVFCSENTGGCTNPIADNYNPDATFDDGSCVISGCTDPNALNYNASANTNDGSCEYCSDNGGSYATLYVCTFSNGNLVTFEILDSNGNVVFASPLLPNNTIQYFDLCLDSDECYTVNMSNSANIPGWFGGYIWINANNGQVLYEYLNADLTSESSIFSLDGSCTAVYGCTDPLAVNYNENANFDDGTCYYAIECNDGQLVTVNLFPSVYPSEISFNIIDENGVVVYTGAGYNSNVSTYDDICLPDGCYTVTMFDSFGDGWNGGYLNLYYNGIATQFSISSGGSGAGAFGIDAEGCVPDISVGCTNPSASNYEPAALYDDGSCIFYGCTDPGAINYNGWATIDDGSCEYCNGEGSVMANLYICTFANGNLVVLEIVDDQGNVVFTSSPLNNSAIINVQVCLMPGVCYTANMINSAGPFGWYGGYFWINANGQQIINAQPSATGQLETVQFSIDGTCGPIFGCTDSNALNYNPEAQVNDGSCQYAVSGCTDSSALNYNPAAIVDDGSCVYAEDCAENFVSFYFTPGTFVSEGSFEIIGANGTILAYGNTNQPVFACLPDGCYYIYMYDTFGDGWDGSGFLDIYSGNSYIGQFTLATGTIGVEIFGLNSEGCIAEVYGCTDPNAINYNPLATADDGSCQYSEDCDQNLISINIVSQAWGSEMSWNLVAADGTIAASGDGYTSWNYYYDYICLADGCYELQLNDSWGDGWNGGYYMISGDGFYYEGTLLYGDYLSVPIGINSDCGVIAGCMDPEALNYNPDANFDNGSCIYNEVNQDIIQNNLTGLELEFSLYPNPTNGDIVMDLGNLNDRENIQIQVNSVDGKLVSSQLSPNSERLRRLNLNLNELPAGYYFIQVTNGTNMKTLPLIKQ